MNTESWKTPGQFNVLVLGVDFRSSHQASVLAEDFLLNVTDFHEAERQKLLQAERKYSLNPVIIFVLLHTHYIHTPSISIVAEKTKLS